MNTAEKTAPAPSMGRSPEAPGLLARGLRELADLTRLAGQTVRRSLGGGAERSLVVSQMYAIGNRSLFFMSVTMAFIGAIIVFQSGTQAKRIVPEMSLLGATYIKLLIRDVAASVGAMPLATRVGAGIAAEIGSMVVTEQVDALRMSDADPVDFLVVPRFIACVVVGTAVLIWSGAVALVVGMLTANALFDVNYHTFMNFSLVTFADLALGVVKCAVFGAAIAIISAHRGLSTYGGSVGVGAATTEAVVGSCFAIIVLNLFISGAAHFLLPG